MMISGVPERARSPTQMSPLLQNLIDKHGIHNQKLISEVIYKYVIKGIKLRDLQLQFDRLDREIVQRLRQKQELKASTKMEMKPALRKSPRYNGNASGVMFDPSEPTVIQKHSLVKQSKQNNESMPRMQQMRSSSTRPADRALQYDEDIRHNQSPVVPRKRYGSAMRNELSPVERSISQLNGANQHYPSFRYGQAGTSKAEINQLAGFNVEGLRTLEIVGDVQDSRNGRQGITANHSGYHGSPSGHLHREEENSPASGNKKRRDRTSQSALPSNIIGGSAMTNQFTAANDLKPHTIRRDENIVRPKKLNMWDMLTLQDTIRKQQEEKTLKDLDRSRKQQMKAFYDMQVAQKREVQKAELVYEQQVRNQIEDKVRRENDRDVKLSYRHANQRREIAHQNQRKQNNTIDVTQRNNDHIRNQYEQKKQLDDITAFYHSVSVNEQQAERKRNNKEVSLKQIQQDEQRIRDAKNVDRNVHLRDLGMQDRNFQQRDDVLHNHRAEINQRGVNMEKYFQNPNIVTHAKQEVKKDNQVRDLQNQLGTMEHQRETAMEKARIERLINMKTDMIQKNAEQLNIRKASSRNAQYQYSMDKVRDNSKYNASAPLTPKSVPGDLLRGLDTAKLLSPKRNGVINPQQNDHATLYNQSQMQGQHRQTTQRQATHQLDILNYQQGTKEKQRILKELLDHQVNEKALIREKDRLYKDEKELATSKQMLRAVHPTIAANTAVTKSPLRNPKLIDNPDQCEIVYATQKGDLAEMGNDDALLSKEVNRLYHIVNRQERQKF